MRLGEGLEVIDGALSVGCGALAFAFNWLFQGWDDAKIGFHGLEVFHVGMGNISTQGAKHGGVGQGDQILVCHLAGNIHPCQEAGGDIANITFHSSDLTGEEEQVAVFGLQGRVEKERRRNEGVAVHLPIANKLGVFQARNKAENFSSGQKI